MAKTKIIFNNKEYSIDESSLAAATTELQSHLSTTMSGSGAVVSLGGVAYNIDSTKLSTATNNFVSHLGTIDGSGSKVVIGGVEYSVDSNKVSDSVYEFENVLFDLTKPKPSEGLVFTSNGDGTCAVSGIGTCADTEVVIPSVSPDGDCVTSIGKQAFSQCTGFTSIIIPNSVTSIEIKAFYSCTSLTSITIPDNLTSIGASAFNYCKKLTDILIPNSVTTMGENAFKQCYALTIYCEAENAPSDWHSSWNPTSRPVYFGFISKERTDDGFEVVITTDGATVMKYLGTNADIVVPEMINETVITSIDRYAFMGNSIVASVSIPDSIITLQNQVFQSCSNLISVTIGNGIKTLPMCLFAYCSNLKNVTIENNVTTIEREVFGDCQALELITFNGTVEQWNAITKVTGAYVAWDNNTGEYTIHCTDGDIAKDGTVTYH